MNDWTKKFLIGSVVSTSVILNYRQFSENQNLHVQIHDLMSKQTEPEHFNSVDCLYCPPYYCPDCPDKCEHDEDDWAEDNEFSEYCDIND